MNSLSPRKRLTALVTATAALLCLCQTQALANCADDSWLRIDEVRSDDGVELRATNHQKIPITFTMRVRGRNVKTEGPRSVTQTLLGKQSRMIMKLSATGGSRMGNYRIACDWTVGVKDAEHNDEVLYMLPYESGASYRVLQGYGSRFSHTGLEQYAIDFNMSVGTPVHAARGGIVARIEESHDRGCWEDGCGKFANYIVVLHDDGTTGEYYHLKKDGALVDEGDVVRAGQKIGLSGNTGHTTMPHLHFAVYRAQAWGETQSIPVRFQSSDGVVHQPRRGHYYRAITATDSDNDNADDTPAVD